MSEAPDRGPRPARRTPRAGRDGGGVDRLCHQCGHRPAVGGKSRCTRCLEQRKTSDRTRVREISSAVFPPALRSEVLRMLAQGNSLAAVHDRLGVTQQRIHTFRTHDPHWAGQVDAALMAGRDNSLEHGRYTTYRNSGCRCPECRAAKAALSGAPTSHGVGQDRVLEILRTTALNFGAAARTAGVQPQTFASWRKADPGYDTAVRAAREEGRRAVLTAAFRAVAAGRSPQEALVDGGRSMTWLYYETARDPLAHQEYDAAKEAAQAARDQAGAQAAAIRAADRAAQRESAERDRMTAREQDRAITARRFRERLPSLLALLEDGGTIKEALASLNLTTSWLHRVRRLVPEADAQIKEAYRAGAARRAGRRATRPAARTGPEQRAMQLVVAAVATGEPFAAACTAGGASGWWVAREYRRNDAFRMALTAAAALHETHDLHTWLAQQHDGNRIGVVSPRPPLSQPHTPDAL